MKKVINTLFVLCCLLLFMPYSRAMAQSLNQDDVNSIYSDTVWYQPSSGPGGCSVAEDVNLNGNDNIQKAFNFFISERLTANQSAGIVGNMIMESGVQPENIQNPAGSSPNPADAGSGGWGIVQWTPADTKVPGIVRDAHITTPVYELGTQLVMVWDQLTGKAGGYSETQAGRDIKGTTTLEQAVRAWEGDTQYGGNYTGFERPQDEQATVNKRIQLASQVLQDYGGSTPDSAEVSSTGCSSVGPGQDTQFVDGFTIYSQYDPSWANKPYGSSTIAVSGCGPTSMAMIITNLTGNSVTPDVTASYAASHGLYVPGEGSSWSIGPVLAKHWNLKSSFVGPSVSKINAALQTGALVIVSGEGPLPFTSGGHFIVIRGLTSDGKWKVGDPAHKEANTQSWDPQQLVTSMNSGSEYAISK